jgi:hypothetical protein
MDQTGEHRMALLGGLSMDATGQSAQCAQCRRLVGCGDKCFDGAVDLARQQMQYGTGSLELLFQQLRFQSQTVAGTLHDRTARRLFAPHEKRDSHEALIADDGNLSRSAIFHHRRPHGTSASAVATTYVAISSTAPPLMVIYDQLCACGCCFYCPAF